MRLSLKQKINVVIIIAFVLIIILYAGIHLSFQNQREQTVMNKIYLLLNTLVERDSEALANEVFERRIRAIRLRLDQMQQVPGVHHIDVFDADHELICTNGLPTPDRKLDPKLVEQSERSTYTSICMCNDIRSLCYLRPIRAVGERIGTIRIHYSLSDVAHERQVSIMLFGAQLATLLLVMFLLVQMCISSVVVKPITRLHHAIRAMAGGNLGTQVNVRSRDEIGELAESFNTMSSELAEADRALRRERDLISLVTETSPVGITMVDRDGRITFANAAVQTILGLSKDHIVQRSYNDPQWQITDFNDQPVPDEQLPFQRVMDTGRSVSDVRHAIRWPDGRRTFLAISAAPIFNADGEPDGMVAVVDNITERVLLEDQLRQAQKMEALGQLAAGIAHDFNNLLMPIIHFTAEAVEKIGPDSTLGKRLKLVKEAGEQAKSLTSQLLALGRRQMIEPKRVNINTMLGEFENMLRRLLRENIELVFLLDQAIQPVMADSSQMHQLIFNTMINAQDAMPDGGRITLSTSSVQLDETFCNQYEDLAAGEYVRISIKDTGTGMEEDVRARVFEPFFTTKKSGKGTGMGMATAYGIIKQHGGHITCESEPGSGTTFHIYLPVAMPGDNPEPDETDPAGTEISDIARTNETIIIAEDDNHVRDIAADILRNAGYNVLISENAEHAVSLATSQTHIDLLLTDVIMPGLNGRELYEKIAAFHKDIRVVYITGYTEGIISHHGIVESNVHLLKKPFSRTDLTHKVRQVLDAEAVHV